MATQLRATVNRLMVMWNDTSEAHQTISYLVRNWSGHHGAQVKFDPSEGAWVILEKEEVHLPDFYNENVYPKMKGEVRWRFIRFLGWHEGMHLRHSPSVEKATKTIESMFNSEFLSFPALKSWIVPITNVVEDYRIENLGVQKYLGYKPEMELHKKVASEIRKRMTVDKYHTWADHEKIMNELIFYILTGEHAPQADLEMIVMGEDSLKIIEEELAPKLSKKSALYKTVGRIILEVLKGVNIPEQSREQQRRMGKAGQAGGEHRGGGLMPDPSQAEMEQEIMEAIIKEMESQKGGNPTTDRLKQEFVRIKQGATKFIANRNQEDRVVYIAQHENSGKRKYRLEVGIQDRNSSFNSSWLAPFAGVEKDLMAQLRRLKIGFEEILGHEGGDMDVGEYLMAKMNGKVKNGKYFYDEEQLSPRTDLAVLVDVSGSTAGVKDLYQRGLGIIGRVLQRLEMKMELWNFTGHGGDCLLNLVKKLDEPWGKLHESRLTGQSHRGGTPLLMALRGIKNRMMESGQDTLVIVTDGMPSNESEVKREIQKMVRLGIKVFMLGISVHGRDVTIEKLFALMGGADPTTIQVIEHLEELPQAFFKLLLPKR